MLPTEWRPIFDSVIYTLFIAALLSLVVYALGFVAPRLAEKKINDGYKSLLYVFLAIGIVIALVIIGELTSWLGVCTALATGLVGWAAYIIHSRPTEK